MNHFIDPAIMPGALPYIASALLGLAVGSFANVLIARIPAGRDFIREPSRCPSCGARLKWRELVPVASYLALRGRCRSCRSPISAQYPLVEAATGAMYVIVYHRFGLSAETAVYCLMAPALLALGVIDFKTYEIPPGFSVFLALVGVLRVLTDLGDWALYAAGALTVSAPLALIYALSGGRAVGGGDVKLMAACGLILGWKLVAVAFVLACVAGSVIHLIRMAVSGEGRVLALGPYLAAGVFAAAVWGDKLLGAYMALYG